MVLLALIILIILIIIFFALALYLTSIFPYGGKTPPFIPSHNKLASLIAETLDPEPESLMYELGAGDMRISLAAWKRQPNARYIGIEKHFFPRMLARFHIWLAKSKLHAKTGGHGKIEAREENLYKTDLTGATHIYCYLFPEAMQILHEKFTRELKPGAVVVSLDFDIKVKEPERTVDLTPYNLKLGKKLYVYRY